MNGIQGHQDVFTSLAAAGIEGVAARVEAEMDQHIDGLNNLPCWRGQNDSSARNHIFHYYESQLTTIRTRAWHPTRRSRSSTRTTG